jgi:hypothetical protein
MVSMLLAAVLLLPGTFALSAAKPRSVRCAPGFTTPPLCGGWPTPAPNPGKEDDLKLGYEQHGEGGKICKQTYNELGTEEHLPSRSQCEQKAAEMLCQYFSYTVNDDNVFEINGIPMKRGGQCRISRECELTDGGDPEWKTYWREDMNLDATDEQWDEVSTGKEKCEGSVLSPEVPMKNQMDCQHMATGIQAKYYSWSNAKKTCLITTTCDSKQSTDEDWTIAENNRDVGHYHCQPGYFPYGEEFESCCSSQKTSRAGNGSTAETLHSASASHCSAFNLLAPYLLCAKEESSMGMENQDATWLTPV